MNAFDNSQYKQMRLTPSLSGENLLSRRKYNMLMCGTVLWGIIVDVIICAVMRDMIYSMYFLPVVIVYFAVTIISTIIIHKSDSAVISFAAFTALAAAMGMLLAAIVTQYTTGSVLQAFVHTGIVCLLMSLMASSFPDFFLKLGRGLFFALLAALAIEIIFGLILGGGIYLTSIAMVFIFSGYFGYDLVRAQQYIPTADNAVDSAADLYVDIVNLFIRLLYLFGNRN